ncbi:MAG: PEP-CTERM sorting domain-containing protein, partial [Planctomycetaceae bacterium]|nr:PEP-CTERM sorting domain-containing protein [Planctomycetaceae bacterium]
ANDLATTQTIMTAGTLNWTPKAVETEGIWNVQQNGQKIELVLDENHLAEAVVSGNDAFAAGNFDEEGWIKITGEAGDIFSLVVGLDGEGDVDELVAWLELQSEEAGQNVKVTDVGGALAFSNLQLDSDGLMFMNYDLASFNLQNGSSFTLASVPEPSAWILLTLGVFGLLGFRRKNASNARIS